MGGKSHADNSQVVEEQKRQAAEAKAKEAARQARIDTGLKKIGYAFEGSPVLKATSHNFDWKGYNDKTALPKGFTRVQVGANGKVIPDTPGQAATKATIRSDPYRGPPEPGYGPAGPGTVSLVPAHAATAATPSTEGTTMIMGPDGKLHKIGSVLTYSTNDPTGQHRGGFDDAFYDNYGNAITDYYGQDLAKQYGKAQDEAAYRLARAGTSVSSAGNTLVTDLAEQNSLNAAGIANKADQQVGDLRAKVANERAKATSQLYATENPDVAANQATAAVRDISLQQPDLSPLAQLFNIATVGATKLMSGVNNQNFIGNFQSGLPPKQGSGNIVSGSG